MNVEQHLERMELALEKLGAKLDSILAQGAELKTEVAVLKDRDRTRAGSISTMGERIGNLEGRVPESFVEEYLALKKRVEKMYIYMTAVGMAAGAAGAAGGGIVFGG